MSLRADPRMSTSRKLGRTAIEFGPPFVVALLLLPFIIQYGKLQPWQPSTIDLQVYVAAVKDMLGRREHLCHHHAVLEPVLHLSADRRDLDDPARLRPVPVLAGGLDRAAWSGPSSRC